MAEPRPYSMKYTPDTEKGTITVVVTRRADGEEVATHDFDIADVHESLTKTVYLYGYSKLLQDRASSEDAGPNKLAAMKEVAQQFAEGQYTKERSRGPTTVSAEVEALAQLKTGGNVAAAQAALHRYDKAQRDLILSNPDIVALAAEIRKERENATEVDLGGLIDAA